MKTKIQRKYKRARWLQLEAGESRMSTMTCEVARTTLKEHKTWCRSVFEMRQ